MDGYDLNCITQGERWLDLYRKAKVMTDSRDKNSNKQQQELYKWLKKREAGYSDSQVSEQQKKKKKRINAFFYLDINCPHYHLLTQSEQKLNLQ